MGAGFSRTPPQAPTSKPDTCGLSDYENGYAVQPNGQSMTNGRSAAAETRRAVQRINVVAELEDIDDDLFLTAAEDGMVTFTLPEGGKMLRLTVGSVTVLVDPSGRMVLDTPTPSRG
jgi:hypothetical protein